MGDTQRTPLLQAMQVVREYGIKYTTLRDRVFSGDLAVVLLGRSWYFERAAVEEMIAKNTVTGPTALRKGNGNPDMEKVRSAKKGAR